jgi:orotidine-5'-phosphate decarboxylase
VVGATLGPSRFDLRGLGGVILAPGLGAQGAGAAEVAALFAGCPAGSVLASASRSLLAAGPERTSLAAAAARARDEVGAALDAGPGVPVG